MRHRITVRADNVELRGYFDGEHESLQEFADNMAPVGMVIASVADDHWNPFGPPVDEVAELISEVREAEFPTAELSELANVLADATERLIYSPRGPISEPHDPPTVNASREVIANIALTAEGAADFMEQIAQLHYSQALVIRGERGRAEQAEALNG